MKSLTLTRGAALLGALMLAPAPVALASGENTPLHLGGTTTAVHTASSGSTIVRTIVGLFIVVAVIYGVAWVLRQAKGKSGRASGHGLEQLASLPLGGGRSVTLVRAGQEVVLLGVAEHGVTPIRTYTEEEALEIGLEVPIAEEGSPGSPTRTRSRGPAANRVLDQLRRMTVRS
jgi:flagellar protein FliO/FliZ